MVKKKASLLRDLYVRRRDLSLPFFERALLSANSSLAMNLLCHLRKKEHLEIVSASVSPLDYTCAETFRNDYLLTEMMSKYPYWDLKINRKEVALQKFLASEAQCLATNRRFSRPGLWSPSATAVIHTARRKIERLLGPFDWNEAVRGFAFGPGSTTRLKRTHADSYYKLSGVPECTYNNLVPSVTALHWFNLWGKHTSGPDGPEVRVVAGNKITTVPKNAKTDRVIAIEPCMNIFIQKGLGSIIRRRLKRVGVDLDDQTVNQRYALEGSITGQLATLDLSAASDTIASAVVEELMPSDWLEALRLCRSEYGQLPSGESVYYQKFSSMGNGFTFELESLIFWAICSAVSDLSEESDRRLVVYGDDIIVPTGIVGGVIDALEFCGFTVNLKKSHVDGPFRESCGKHYFNGVDVTPIYVKDRVDSYPRYIWLANQSKRWSRHIVWGLAGILRDPYDLVVGSMSGFWSYPHIPDGVGDGALIGDFSEVLPKRAPNGQEGYVAQFFTEKRDDFLPDDTPILLKSLYRLERKSPSVGDGPEPRYKAGYKADSPISLAVPLDKRRYRLVKRAVWQWPTFGPWLD